MKKGTTFHHLISSEQAWRDNEVSLEELWVNDRTLSQGLGGKKSSQGMMMNEITPQDIMGRVGLYFFLGGVVLFFPFSQLLSLFLQILH